MSTPLNGFAARDISNWQKRQLHWVHDTATIPFAPWAIYFLDLGHRLAHLPNSLETRSVIGFVLPVLDHAAVLTATGLVCQLAQHRVTPGANPERFARLAELPLGHPVRVLSKNGRLFNGHVVDPSDLPRTLTQIPITVSTGAHSQDFFLCTSANCMRVEPTMDPSEADHEQRGMRIVDSPDFMSALLEGLSPESLCLGTRQDYALVGTSSILLEEARAKMAIGPAGKARGLTGTAYDLIRLRHGTRDHRGVIVPATASQPTLSEEPPRFAIFSGAAGFLRLRHRFPSSHHLVLIDRSEPRHLEAVNQLNRQFFQRTGDGDPTLAGNPPAGVEHIGFLER